MHLDPLILSHILDAAGVTAPRQRECMVLLCCEGLDVAGAALVMRISRTMVYRHLSRARGRIVAAARLTNAKADYWDEILHLMDGRKNPQPPFVDFREDNWGVMQERRCPAARYPTGEDLRQRTRGRGVL